MESTIGPERNLLLPEPESCRQINVRYPIIDNDQLAKLRHIQDHAHLDGFRSVTLPMMYDPREGGAALERAMARAAGAGERRRAATGNTILILSDRGVTEKCAPIPSLLATAGVHHHLVREGTRTRCALVLESGDAREVHHVALLIGYGAGAVNPYLAFETLDDMIAQGMVEGVTREKAIAELHQGAQQGHPQGDVQDGHLDAAELLRRADFRGHRPRTDVCRPLLHVDGVAHRRRRHRRHRARGQGAPRARVPGAPAGARRSRIRRRVPLAARRRAAPLQPRDGAEAAARDPHGPVCRLPGLHQGRQRPEPGARHAARPARFQARPAAGADRRGRAGRGDPQALRDRRDVVRLDQPGGARDDRHRDEPPRRQVEHRRRRRGSGALSPRRQRRLAPQRHQAGRLGPLRRHERVPGQRRRPADQDGAGRQAGRGRPAPRAQGLSLDCEGPLLDARGDADFAAAASRHLLDRGPGAAHPRSEERQSGRARARQARRRGRRRHGRRRRVQGPRRRRADLRPRRRHRRVAADLDQARRHSRGSSASPRRSRSCSSTASATASSCRWTGSSRPAGTW